MGRLALIPWWWRRLITVRVLMWHPSIIVRLMQRFRQTGNVTDRLRAGRPRKTRPREDRFISRRARQRPFSRAGALCGNLAFGCHISTRTAIKRLHHQGMRAWRPIKRPPAFVRKYKCWKVHVALYTPCHIHINKNRSIACFTGK
jgi:transposase